MFCALECIVDGCTKAPVAIESCLLAPDVGEQLWFIILVFISTRREAQKQVEKYSCVYSGVYVCETVGCA